MSDSLTDIAIIGMAGRFPGARDTDELWRNLCDGIESISHFSVGELEVENAASLARLGNYVMSRAVMDDADKFDAPFFGINPRETELIDPQQRVFLECCWHAFEDAGYDPLSYERPVGVYAGCSPNSYFLEGVCADREFIKEYTGGYQVSNFIATLGANFEFLPTRVAYKLNLKGPAFSLNSGCSTSLVAVAQACLSLQNYQCDMALAGGVSITFPQKRGYLYEPGGMVSPDGHCRTFDESAQGTVFGDGAGVVLLKRLADAIADGDHIYAVVRGFGVTNDGSTKVGFTAPGVDGQARAIAIAHAAADIDPRSITYVEAHGTGTPLGDPIEIAALTQAFRRGTVERQFCAIGAAKTNFGHLDVAAGIAGLIKTALSLQHKMLPPVLNFTRPNPNLDLENSPFFVNTSLRPWTGNGTPLRAGVSAFGMGGTNAHVVLEEAPAVASAKSTHAANLIVLSAKTESALDTATENLAHYITANSSPELADIAHTLMVGRHSFEVRRILVSNECGDAATALTNRDLKRIKTRSSRSERPQTAFMFPGQGAQYLGMACQLYANNRFYRDQVDTCVSGLHAVSGLDLRSALCAEASSGDTSAIPIDETSNSQPALFIVEYALSQFWMRLGIRPSAMIGHSVGEFVAATLAGVFSLDDALRLVAARGRLMQAQPRGAMLSVRLPEDRVNSLLRGRLSLAAVNGPTLSVVAGPIDEIEKLEKLLETDNVVSRRLRTSHAFHSSMMDEVCAPFSALVARVRLSSPRIPFVSGVSGSWISEAEATDPQYWSRHLRMPVRFSPGIRELRSSDFALLEVGPGNTLSMLARQQEGKSPDQLVISSLPNAAGTESDEAAILNALGHLWLHGAQPEWEGLYPGEQRRRLSLPLYPFERKRYWIEPVKTQRPVAARSLPDSKSTNSADTGSAAEIQTENLAKAGQIGNVAQPGAADPSPVDNMELELTQTTHRQERIRSILESIFEDLSGMDVASIGNLTTFLEMGFDSLFLTQVSQALQAKFSLKITFRQLLDQLSTLDTLATYVDQNLPAEALGAQVPTKAPSASIHASAPAVAPMPARSDLQAPPPHSVSSIDLEALFKSQMQMMSDLISKQMEVLRQTPTYTLVSQTSPIAEATPSTPNPEAVAPEIEVHANGRGPQPRKFVPFRAVEVGAGSDLTPDQQGHLKKLIDSYTKQTAGSKQFTQKNRLRLADPRVAAGFRLQWKELVYPIVTVRSQGSKVWDLDGNEYIDVVNGYGPVMFGHAPDFVNEAVRRQLEQGYETGPQSPLAGEIADLCCEMTGMERVTFCNTGSEAVVAALRVARTITGRNKIVLFTGAYHGMFDEVVVKGVPSAKGPRSLPVAPGIPREMVDNVTVLEYGTPAALSYITSHASELAAVLVEPVQSRHPGLQPVGFLKQVREITERSGTALIFDEVVTGFRVHPGGCQALFGIRADLATYGKVIGGGLPIGVLAGKAAFMDALDGGMWCYGDDSYPQTGVTFYAGTFVRHPLALAATLAVFRHLKEEGPKLQDGLANKTERMAEELNGFLEQRQLPTRVETFRSIACFSFPPELKFAGLLYYYMRARGVHIQEGFPMFLTTAHSDEDIARVVQAFQGSILDMQAAGFLPVAPTTDSTTLSTTQPAFANGSDQYPIPRERQVSNQTAAANASPELSRSPRRQRLTESQMEIWLSASLGEEANCSYNESFTLKIRGELDKNALRRAVDGVVARHEALRASFHPEADFQEFTPELKLDIPVVDLSSLDEADKRERLKFLIDEDARTPFNLITGPLVRAQLISLSSIEHHLLVTCHHIVCDGWSTNVILDELSRLYGAFREGKQYDLPVPMSFGDYARTQAEYFASVEGAAAEKYWVKQFEEPAPLLDLPLDRPRPPIKSYNGATRRRAIETQTYLSIKKACARQKCTLFVALLAGFEALLSRLSGQNDVVVGIPAAGQLMLEDQILVGHCVNFLPIRGRIPEDRTIAEHLAQVRRTVLDAYDQQNYTYGRLIRKLSIQREPSRLPLMEVQFNLERLGSGIEFSNLEVEVEPNAKAFVNQDLFLNVIESDQGLILDCDYNTRLFDESTIDRWLSHYQALVSGMIADLDQPVSRIPILSEDERHRILVEWNATRSEYPRNCCVHQLFEEQARRTPDSLAVVYEDQQLTYDELNRKTSELAAYLGRLGVRPGVLVGVYVERSVDMIVALLGVLKAGGAYVPMDPTYPADRISFVLEDANAPILLTQEKLAQNLSAIGTRLILLDTNWEAIAEGSSGDTSVTPPQPDDLAYVIYTSGSTGKPKGVEISHRAVVNLLCSMRKKPGIEAKDTLLAVTTLSFDIAVLELFLPLCAGAKLVIATREAAADGNQLLSRLSSSGASVIQATPVTFRLLIEAGWNGDPKLRVLCGGEALPRDLADKLVTLTRSLWNMYGPTETTIWSSTIAVRSGENPVPIGPPIDNTQFYVLDAANQLCPIGRPGELHIGGEGIARGYFRQPELTAEKFIRNPFSDESGTRLYKTGDLVRRLPDGTLEFLGRLDNQIKLRGFRIELGEIETALARYPGIRDAVVTLREDVPGDKRLVAYVATDHQALTTTAVREFLTGKLPNYMLPSAVVRLDAMPLTPNGKIDRRALPVPDQGARGEQVFIPPQTEREKALAGIWAEILRVDQVGIRDNLFELGADSLHIFQIAARAGKAGIKIAPAQFLKYRTIEEVLAQVASQPQDGGTAEMPRIAKVSREKYRVKRSSL